MKSIKQQPLGIPNLQSNSVPSPFQSIVDVNLDRNNIVYEVELSRDHGLEIIQGNGYAIVGNVPKGSKVEQLGILSGDIVIATSATAGNQLWTHDSVDSIKSALSTRFVLYPTVKIRLERSLNLIPAELKHLILVPYITTVIVKRPLGLHVAEGEKSKVFIQHMKEDCGAAKTKRLEIGDQVVAMTASWGDQMWTITSVESFIMSVRMHTSPTLSLRVKRLVPLDIYLGQIVTARMQRQLVRQQKSQHKKIDINNKFDVETQIDSNINLTDNLADSKIESEINNKLDNDIDNKTISQIDDQIEIPLDAQIDKIDYSIIDRISKLKTKQQITEFYLYLSNQISNPMVYNNYVVNKLLSVCLSNEEPELAVEIFEKIYSYRYLDVNPANYLLNSMNNDAEMQSIIQIKPTDSSKDSKYLPPNNYVCTTAIKAYGRLGLIDEALGLLDWYENLGEVDVDTQVDNNLNDEQLVNQNNKPIKRQVDSYFLTALLYVCAKSTGQLSKPITRYIDKYVAKSTNSNFTTYQSNYISNQLTKQQINQLIKQRYIYHTKQAEKIFFNDYPRRGLPYSIPSINSLMYMYAKKRDANAVLKLYELSKTLGLTCTVVTYGVIIKALLRSKNPKLQVKSFEILKSLPNLGITPGVEIFNQFLEFYSSTCNYKMAKKVLVLMSRTKPKVKPDVVSYGYLINCFAVSKKPKSALMIYYQMRQRNIQPNGFTYMGILKALSYLRDGRSAFLILREMEKYSEIDSSIDNNLDGKIDSKLSRLSDEKVVIADKRHYSMAMFACVFGNQCLLAQQIFHRYIDKYVDKNLAEYLSIKSNSKLDSKLDIRIDSKVKPDTTLSTLYLRALLQQREWDRGLNFYHMMESGLIFDKPNEQTILCLLTYQILDERYLEANEIVSNLINSPFINRAIDGIFDTLAFTLGKYSNHMRKMYNDDTQYYDTMSGNFLFSQEDDPLLDLIDPIDSTIVVGTKLLDSSIEDNSLDEIDKKIYYAGEGGNLRTPTYDGLLFTIETLRKLSLLDKFTVQTNFYVELLDACSNSGFNDLTQLLVSFRRSNNIKFKQIDKDKLVILEEKIVNNKISNVLTDS